MGKNEKTGRSPRRTAVTAVAVAVAALLVLFAAVQIVRHVNSTDPSAGLQNSGTDGSAAGTGGSGAGTAGSQENNAPALQFPYLPEDGMLEVESLFPFSGINPDCGRQEAEDIASLSIQNISQAHLISADICVVLNDGTELAFAVSDLPPGKTAMAFCLDNRELPDGAACTQIRIESVFEEAPAYEGLTVSADGMSVTVENTAQTEIHNIVVYYRDVFQENYFGGVTYSIRIENLSAGESTTVLAEDSLLGIIEVVRVAVEDEN